MSESSGESLQLKKSSGAGGTKVIQRLKSGIRCKDGVITSGDLWGILKKITDNRKPLSNGNKDFYDTFINLKVNDGNGKIIFGGTEFERNDKNNYIYYQNKGEKGTKNKYKGSYPELAELLKNESVKGQDDAKKMRGWIQNGVSIGAGIVKQYSSRKRDDTLKQTTLALFGAETTRSPRIFLTSMMLLDNMQSGIGYGKGNRKEYVLSSMLQRGERNGKYSLKTKNKFIYYGNSVAYGHRSGEQIKGILGAGLHFTTDKRSIAGGKFASAGADSMAQGQANDKFHSNNIVHNKEVGILINWLKLQGEPFSSGTVISDGFELQVKENKSTVKKKIEELVKKRASSYEYMEDGKNESEISKEYKKNESKNKAKYDYEDHERSFTYDEKFLNAKIVNISNHIERLKKVQVKREKRLENIKQNIRIRFEKLLKQEEKANIEVSEICGLDTMPTYEKLLGSKIPLALFENGKGYYNIKCSKKVAERAGLKYCCMEESLLKGIFSEMHNNKKRYGLGEGVTTPDQWHGAFQNKIVDEIINIKTQKHNNIISEIDNVVNRGETSFDKKINKWIKQYNDKNTESFNNKKIETIKKEIEKLNKLIVNLEREKKNYGYKKESRLLTNCPLYNDFIM
ncbi:hypothetical protein [[Clostridium] polysaccharolyticum]|nr:hypothetical protein [[Clostridium] polysaccharolyticum]